MNYIDYYATLLLMSDRSLPDLGHCKVLIAHSNFLVFFKFASFHLKYVCKLNVESLSGDKSKLVMRNGKEHLSFPVQLQ